VFWTVWCMAALSLMLILYVPSVAQVFRVAPPAGTYVSIGVIAGVLSVGWRLIPAAIPSRMAKSSRGLWIHDG
jgi:hypothetical protein